MSIVAPGSRRRFLQASVGLLAFAAASPLQRLLADTPAPQNTITPGAALKRLMDGNARYVANQLDIKDFSAGRAARAKAQYPIASILSCADSRVAPELLFDQNPGDLFVVRIAGNYLNPDALASLEYGVAVLHTPLVMVLGHTGCGAIKSAIAEIQNPEPLPGRIWDITEAVRPGIQGVVQAGGDDLAQRAVDANVEYNVARVARAQPILSQAVASGRVQVAGGTYELATGKVRLLTS